MTRAVKLAGADTSEKPARTRTQLAPRPEAPFAQGAGAIDTTAIERALRVAMSTGGTFADLYFEYRRAASLSMEDGRVRAVGGGVDLGVGVRVVKGSAVGYAYTESLEPERVLEAARTAARIAAGAKRARVALTEIRTRDRYRVPDEVLDLEGTQRVELLRRADRAARAASPKISRVDVSMVSVHREILVASSTGGWVFDRQPMVRFSVSAVATKGDRRESGSSGGGGRLGVSYFEERTPESYGEEAARIALVNLDSRPAPAGAMPVVLGPGESGILLHEAVGHGLEADFNRRRTSNYTDRIGQRVASKKVTVLDDPTLLGGARGSINVDDEGVVPRVHTLIEDGVLRGYLHDRITSAHFGLEPSGSGRRESFRHAPMPRMSNTLLAAGDADPEEIVRSVKRGIYAAKFTGGQVNISNGDFVFAVSEGYLIEDGKITAPLRGVNLIGNGPEAMTTVSMVGHDFRLSDGLWTCGKDGQSVPVGVGMPTVKLDQMTIGGTEV